MLTYFLNAYEVGSMWPQSSTRNMLSIPLYTVLDSFAYALWLLKVFMH